MVTCSLEYPIEVGSNPCLEFRDFHVWIIQKRWSKTSTGKLEAGENLSSFRKICKTCQTALGLDGGPWPNFILIEGRPMPGKGLNYYIFYTIFNYSLKILALILVKHINYIRHKKRLSLLHLRNKLYFFCINRLIAYYTHNKLYLLFFKIF